MPLGEGLVRTPTPEDHREIVAEPPDPATGLLDQRDQARHLAPPDGLGFETARCSLPDAGTQNPWLPAPAWANTSRSKTL